MLPAKDTRATIEDLFRVEGRTELIGGKIITYKPGGCLPGHVMMEVAASLDDHAKASGRGEVWTSCVVYAIEELPSGRESFSPNISYHLGGRNPKPLQHLPGPPTFAVEVRFLDDYGPAADLLRLAKRADYFEAGTRVVWDVDTMARLIHVYRRDNPTRPTTYARGDVAEAEPAVEGWRVAVDQVFG